MRHSDAPSELLADRPNPVPDPLASVVRAVLAGHPHVAFMNDPEQAERWKAGEQFAVLYGVFRWTRAPRAGAAALHVVDGPGSILGSFWTFPEGFSVTNAQRFEKDVRRFERELRRGSEGRVLRCWQMADHQEAMTELRRWLGTELMH